VIPYLENSPSIFYRATHILHLRIVSAQIGEWAPAQLAGVSRSADLELNLVSVFKGRTQQKPGESLAITVIQYGTGTSRQYAVPGVWSPVNIEAGEELIAFCRGAVSGSSDCVTLLGDAHCELITPANSTLAGVQLAQKIENTKPASTELFALISPLAADLDYYFTEYLWARLMAPAFADIKVFDQLVNFLSDPNLDTVARATLLDLIYGRVYGTAYASEDHIRHFAAGLFRLLEVSQAHDLHDNILSVFLPNLLGIRGGADRCHPDDIFAAAPPERGRAAENIEKYSGSVDVQPLKEWLK
jgi:hypothetical protein